MAAAVANRPSELPRHCWHQLKHHSLKIVEEEEKEEEEKVCERERDCIIIQHETGD